MVGTEKRSHANRQRTWWKGKGAYFRPRFFFSRRTFIGKTRLGFSPLSRNNKNGGIYAKVSGSRFWVVPIGLIQHQLLKRRQLMDKGTSDSSVATAVSKTNPTTTPDGAPTGDSRFILFLFSARSVNSKRIEFLFLLPLHPLRVFLGYPFLSASRPPPSQADAFAESETPADQLLANWERGTRLEMKCQFRASNRKERHTLTSSPTCRDWVPWLVYIV